VLGVQPEQAIDGLPDNLSPQIVQGDIQRGAGGAATGGQILEHILQLKWIIPKVGFGRFQVSDNPFLRLAVINHGWGFARASQTGMLQVGDDIMALVAGAVGDPEGGGQVEGDWFPGKFHGGLVGVSRVNSVRVIMDLERNAGILIQKSVISFDLGNY
jgi:hypothetical protein